MTILLPLLVCLIGMVVYALSNNAKVCALALYAYACGLLAFLLLAGPQVLGLLHK
jgi:hypothetical protein